MRWTHGSMAMIALTACTQGGPGAPDAAADLRASCEALVAADTGARPEDVSAVSTRSVPTGTVTTVAVTGAEAPWLCRADVTGVVTGVEYSTQD